MRLPLVAPLGNRIPLRSQIPGRTFRQDPQLETASHLSAEYWDALSAESFNRKLHPIPTANSGMDFPKPRPSGKTIPPCLHPGMELSALLLGLGSATWRLPGGVLLHESHRMVRKEARVRFVAVLHLAIHPANARDRIIQNRLIIRMMENVAPDARHGAPPC